MPSPSTEGELKFLVNKILRSVLAFEVELAEVHRDYSHTAEDNSADERDNARKNQHADRQAQTRADYDDNKQRERRDAEQDRPMKISPH